MAYDVEMIKDFIEQLKWSLRVDHFEMSAGPNAISEELVEQVARCNRKRGVPRLLSEFFMTKDRPELADKEMREAVRRFGAWMAEKRAEQLKHLEALEELLEEACAHAVGRVIKVSVPGSKVLDGTFFKGKDGD
jgi:hypothetical protein